PVAQRAAGRGVAVAGRSRCARPGSAEGSPRAGTGLLPARGRCGAAGTVRCPAADAIHRRGPPRLLPTGRRGLDARPARPGVAAVVAAVSPDTSRADAASLTTPYANDSAADRSGHTDQGP